MTQGVIVFVAVAVFLGAVLAAALRSQSGRMVFLGRWIMYTLVILGLEMAAAMLGQTTRNVLCGSVWYAECS